MKNSMRVAKIFVCVFCLLTIAACMPSVMATQNSQLSPSDYFDNPGTIKLCDSIASKNAEAIRISATNSAINDIGKHGMTPLLWALLLDSKEGVAVLAKAGADPHIHFLKKKQDLRKKLLDKGMAAIHLAARKEDSYYLDTLLSNGADSNIPDKAVERFEPIYHAIEYGKSPEEHIQLLAKYKADLDLVDHGIQPTVFSSTALGRFDTTLLLLKAGADHTMVTNGRKTRLIHLLLRDKALKNIQESQKVHYENLLNWLEAHGESIDRARADIATGEF